MLTYTPPASTGRKGSKTGLGSMLLGGAAMFGLGLAKAWKAAKTPEERDAFPQFWKDAFGDKKKTAEVKPPAAPEAPLQTDAKQVADATVPKTVSEVSGAEVPSDVPINEQYASMPGVSADGTMMQRGDDGGYQDAWNSAPESGVNIIPEQTAIPMIEPQPMSDFGAGMAGGL